MTLLAAAVSFVGCLCLLDLLLTFGVLRRLREHSALLAGTGADTSPGLAVGQRPASFVATSSSGAAITSPSGLRVAAFFSSSCSVCPGKVAPFLQYVRSAQLSPDSVLVLIATETEPAAYLAELSEATTVCVEPHGGPVSAAFGLAGFPSFFLLDADGVILASAFDPDSLPEPVTA